MNILFILKTAILNIKRQKFVTFALVLVMFLIFILLNVLGAGLFLSYKYGNYLQQQQLAIQVFFVNDCEANSIGVKEFVSEVISLNQHNSYEYISSKEVHDKKWEEYFINDQVILDSKPENPCDLLAEFKVNPSDYNSARSLFDKVNSLSATNKYPIYNISYSYETQKQWEDNIARVQYGIISAMIFLGIVVFVVINLLVDVSIRSRVDEIGIMQLVGAKRSQVGTIFVFEGIIYGFLATTLSLCLVIAIYFYFINLQSFTIFEPVKNFLSEIGVSPLSFSWILIIAGTQVLVGILLGIINNLISVRKYL